MAILSNIIIFILLIHLALIFSQEQGDLCPIIRTILCVKDVLLKISSAAEEINGIGQQIKQSIYEHELISTTLDNYIDYKIKSIRLNLPSKYHHQFMNEYNNINRTSLINLINLIQEENYAFSFLYNSINNILKMENPFRGRTEKSFNKTLNILRKNILCNYRNILHVYSARWFSIDEINGIQILNPRKQYASSLVYNGYSMIVIRLLQEWIKNINEFVADIEKKL